MLTPGVSLPPGPRMYVVNWRVSSSFQTSTLRHCRVLPLEFMDPRIVSVLVAASYVPSDVIGVVRSESTQVETYFFFAGSNPVMPCPSKGADPGLLFFLMIRHPPRSTLFPYTTPF